MMATFSRISFFFGIVLAVHSFKLEERKEDIKSLEPSWVPLCDKGHSYLFSDAEDQFGLADWNNAKWKCASLGGYLVKIENRHENNCILVHAQKQGLHHYWWTAGIL